MVINHTISLIIIHCSIIIIIIIYILFNERHHSTFDSEPKNVIAEATRHGLII